MSDTSAKSDTTMARGRVRVEKCAKRVRTYLGGHAVAVFDPAPPGCGRGRRHRRRVEVSIDGVASERPRSPFS